MTAVVVRARPLNADVGLHDQSRPISVNVNGGPAILAFLDCPAANDGGAESIVAFFLPSRTSKPICFDHIPLMRERGPRAFYYGGISALDVRALPDASHVAVLTLEGGDAGDSWVSYALVHIDSKCRATLLARSYASMHRDTDLANPARRRIEP